MATANKTPPMIAPGIVCPKCKGACTDERANKRTDKSPDYLCANILCTDKTGKYRTGIWLEKGNGSGAEAPSQSVGGEGNPGKSASAPPADSAKPKMRDAYKSLTEWVLKEIVPLYDAEYGEGACDPSVVAACVQTLFIQACYAGKVE